jgi:hypothetical protein
LSVSGFEYISEIGRPLSEGRFGDSEGRLIPADEPDRYFGFVPVPIVVPAGLENCESNRENTD